MLRRRRLKLVSSLNGKKKLLADVKKKPDPLSREPGLRRDIDRFNTQCHNLVRCLIYPANCIPCLHLSKKLVKHWKLL